MRLVNTTRERERENLQNNKNENLLEVVLRASCAPLPMSCLLSLHCMMSKQLPTTKKISQRNRVSSK
jgi:hypothetical protein